MIVQEEDDASMDDARILKKSKKYIVVKNHVRELVSGSESSSLSVGSDTAVVEKSSEVKTKRNLKRKNVQDTISSVSESAAISNSDLKELKAVYSKCKKVLRKIESKYGHLINIADDEPLGSSSQDGSSTDDCDCSPIHKITFDENGKQIETLFKLKNHICIKRMKRTQSDSQLNRRNVEIEYNDSEEKLPDNLLELDEILKNSDISQSYRRMVINKMYLTRQKYLNIIRYEKHSIIKQLKENPDELLDFKGSNISSLPGYPTVPISKTDNGISEET